MVSSPLTDTAPEVTLPPAIDLEDPSRCVQPSRVDNWMQPTVEDAPDEDEEGAWQIYRRPTTHGMDSLLSEENTPHTSHRSTVLDVVPPLSQKTSNLAEPKQHTRVDKGKRRASNSPHEHDAKIVDCKRMDSLNALKPNAQGWYIMNSAKMRKQKLNELSVKYGLEKVLQDQADVEEDRELVLLIKNNMECEQQLRVSDHEYDADHGESSGSGSSNARSHSSSPPFEGRQSSPEATSTRSDHPKTKRPCLRTKNEVRASPKSQSRSTSRSRSKSIRRPSVSPTIVEEVSSDEPGIYSTDSVLSDTSKTSIDPPPHRPASEEGLSLGASPSIIEQDPSDQLSLRTRDSDPSNVVTISSQPPISSSPSNTYESTRIPSPHLSHSASLRRATALSPRHSTTILRTAPVPALHSKFRNALVNTLCCRPGSVTPTQPSRLPVRAGSVIPSYIKKKAKSLRKPKTVRFDMVQRQVASAASTSAMSPRRSAMSLSSSSEQSRRGLTGAVPLSDMIVRSTDSVRSTPPPPPSDGGLGAKIRNMSLADLRLRPDEREEIRRLMRDVERDRGKGSVSHPYALSKEEDDEIRKQVEGRVKYINDKAEKDVLEKRTRERALKANTWPTSSSSSSAAAGSGLAPSTTNGDTAAATNGGSQGRRRRMSCVSSQGVAQSSSRHVRFVEEEDKGEECPFTNGVGVEQDDENVRIRDV